MDSKTDNVMVMDCNTVANAILRDINDIDRMERMLSSELTSEDLFRIDCAILTSLKNTKDFSRNLLHQLEEGKFEAINTKPVTKSVDDELASIQKQTMINITQPLQNMFDEMLDYIPQNLD